MKNMKRFLSILVCVLVMSQTVMAADGVPDTPSNWALFELQFADAYALGDTANYMNYQGEVTGRDLLAVEATLENTYQVVDPEKVSNDEKLTRGQVINELFDVIEQAVEIDPLSLTTELDYMVKGGIIVGRTGGDYALEELCTKEELLLLGKRVYDHIAYALDKDSKGAYWTVSDEDNTIHLLGSIHIMNGSAYPINDKAMLAFVQSDVLVLEINLLAITPEDQLYVQQVGMLPQGQTIDQLISEETYKKYAEKMEANVIPKVVYDQLKVWKAGLTVMSIDLANNQMSGSIGVDNYFLSLAYQMQKPIEEFENVRFQIDLFDNMSEELQTGLLEGVLTEEEATVTGVEGMIEAWVKGDMDALSGTLSADDENVDPATKEFNDTVFHERNVNMLAKVKDMLAETDKDYFVVVGAGHMLTDTGIVQGLRDAGYEVNQVK